MAELKAMIEDQDEKLKVRAENTSLEIKLAELRAANDLWSGEDSHINVKLAEHQLAVAELLGVAAADVDRAVSMPRFDMRVVSANRDIARDVGRVVVDVGVPARCDCGIRSPKPHVVSPMVSDRALCWASRAFSAALDAMD